MFTLNIRTDNDAFQDGNMDLEVSRILRATADRLERGEIQPGNSATLRDVNGNDVGRAKLEVYDR